MVTAALAVLLALPAAAAPAANDAAWDEAVLWPMARYALDVAAGDGMSEAGLIDADAAANVVLRVSVEEDPSSFAYWVRNLSSEPVRVDYREVRAEEATQRARLDALVAARTGGRPPRLGASAAEFLARTAAVLRLASPAGPEAVAAGWEFFGFRRGGVEDLPSIGTRARAQSLKMLRAHARGAEADPARRAAAEALWLKAQESAHDTQFMLIGEQVREAALARHPSLEGWGAGRSLEAAPSAESWATLLKLSEERLDPRGRGRAGALWVALDAAAARTLADALDLLAARGFPAPEPAAARRPEPAAREYSDVTSTGNFLLPTREALEVVTIGAAVLDYDHDGRPDLFLGGGRRRGGRLFHNLGAMRFEETRLVGGLRIGERAAAADYDGDGWTDLLVLGDPESETHLFRNMAGKGFRDVTAESGLSVPRALVEDAVWFDADGDGDLDVYLAALGRNTDRVTPAADGANGSPNSLFLNEGGKFREATAGSGLEDSHWSWAVEALDYDGDGRDDVALCNLWGPSRLFHALGGGRFEEAGHRAGLSLDGLCRGLSSADMDGDGRADLFLSAGTAPQDLYRAFGAAVSTSLVTQDAFTQGYARRPEGWQEDVTLLNAGAGTFRRASTTTLVGRSGMSWNGLLADLDLDGVADLYQVNGFYPDTLFFHDERKVLRHGRGDGSFTDALPGNGADFLGCSRASLTADLDGDLCPDLVVTGLHGTRLLKGLCPRRNGGLSLSLSSPAPNTAAVGARVEVTSGGRLQTFRWGGLGGGQVTSFWGRQLVGLGSAAAAESVSVIWPGGDREDFGPLKAGTTTELRRGSGRKAGDGRR